MTSTFTRHFGELRSASAAKQLDRMDDLLRDIILTGQPEESLTALDYACHHTGAERPWRWGWWAMCLKDGLRPTREPGEEQGTFPL